MGSPDSICCDTGCCSPHALGPLADLRQQERCSDSGANKLEGRLGLCPEHGAWVTGHVQLVWSRSTASGPRSSLRL